MVEVSKTSEKVVTSCNGCGTKQTETKHEIITDTVKPLEIKQKRPTNKKSSEDNPTCESKEGDSSSHNNSQSVSRRGD